MSMFIELFSEDVAIHGDGEDTEASFNVTGWPFNMDLGGAAASKISASIVEGETTTQIECENVGSQVTIRFPEPIPGGETKTVRLRAKVFI